MTASRERVETAFARAASGRVRHLIIRASAGSGKTFRLSSRYIILLALGAAPETILATTFTRKAAAEILERVLRRLASAAENEPGACALSQELSEDLGVAVALTFPEVRSLLDRLCSSLHRVSISTLDRHFNKVAASFRFELGLPADCVMLDEQSAAASELRREAINGLLEGNGLEKNVRLLFALQRENAGCSVADPLDRLLAELREIYLESSPEAWERFRPTGVRLMNRHTAGMDRHTVGADDELEALRDEFEALARSDTGKLIQSAAEKMARAIGARAWRDCFASGPLKNVIEGKELFGKKPLTDKIFLPFFRLKDHVAAVLIDQLAVQTIATRDLLARFDGRFVRIQRRERIVFFSDLTRILGGRFGAPASMDRHTAGMDRHTAGENLRQVAYRMDGRVRHLMLDEFQDTSPAQWRVLCPLASEIVSEGPPEFSGRSFFCVGDVKQAIYGWRGGVARIFEMVRADLHLGEHNLETLDISRRSAQVILDALHKVFFSLDANVALSDCPSAGRRWKNEFPLHVSHDKTMRGCVELVTSPGTEMDSAERKSFGDDNSDNDASSGTVHEDCVVKKVRGLAVARPRCTIGVLVRTNAAGQKYLTLLRRAGLNASGEGGNRLDLEPAVNLVLSTFLLAAHPGDTASAFHLLNSPLAASLGLASLDPNHLAQVALNLRAQILDEGLAAVVGSLAAEIAPHCDPASGAVFRLERLISLAEEFRSTDPLRPENFVTHVRDTSVEEPSPARIRVMTVHKAKGLEFDIVVMPELMKMMGQVSSQVHVMRDDPGTSPTAVFRSGSALHCALSPQLAEARDQEVERRLDDDLAGLYVAMTRARHGLYMVIPPITRKNDGNIAARGFCDMSFAALLRHALSTKGEEENSNGDDILFANGDPAWEKAICTAPSKPTEEHIDVSSLRITLADSLSSRSIPRIAPSSIHESEVVTAGSIFDASSSPARNRGLLIHKWLEEITWLDEPGIPPADDELLKIARRNFPRMAVDQVKTELVLFRGILDRGHVREVLVKPAGMNLQLWRERSFVAHMEGRAVAGRFDRVVVFIEDNRPVGADLIDFKTDEIEDDAALIAATDRYRPQVVEYRKALAMLLSLPMNLIKARLLFIDRVCVNVG